MYYSLNPSLTQVHTKIYNTRVKVTINNMSNKDKFKCHAAVNNTLSVIGGKWRPLILWHLLEKTMRFSELQRSLQSISQKILISELRKLEYNRIIERRVYPQIPPKVEYHVSAYGLSLKPVLEKMADWGAEHRPLNPKLKKPAA